MRVCQTSVGHKSDIRQISDSIIFIHQLINRSLINQDIRLVVDKAIEDGF